jgi:putative endopeptidase
MNRCCSALVASLLWLGCAQTQVTPPRTPPDAGQPIAGTTLVGDAGATAADGAVALSHFDPSLVDRSLDPCVDFYQYACSRWIAANPIPADQPLWWTSSNLQIWNQTALRQTMEKASRPDPQRSANEQKIGDYWIACMDEGKLDQQGLGPIAQDLKRIATLKSKAGLAKEIARLHSTVPGSTAGVQNSDTHTQAPLFGFGPIQDFANSALVVANLDQGGMGLPSRDFYLSDDAKMKSTREKYAAHVRKLLELLGESPKAAAADTAAVLRIETALARRAMDVVKRRDPKNVYNVRTLAQVRAATPSFDWKAYLAGVSAPMSKHLIVSSPDFLTGMEQALRKEPLSAWKAYLRWWTLHGNASYLSKPFVDENFDFNGRVLTGAEELQPRWRRCVRYADRDLGEALGLAYVERAFPPDSKQRAQDMVHAIEHALGDSIAQNDWMNPATKKEAAAKLAAIEDKIGYPTVWRDYSSLQVGRESLATNVHAATAFELHRQLAKIGKPVDRVEWLMTPPTIDAYYDPQLNTINFPAGILQPPFFENRPPEANFGSIGMIIGHEIVHGFDDQGRKFDAQGNLRDWWTAEDAKRYEEKGKCISDEYTQEIPDLGVKQNGLLTQGEDTADNGGLRLAYAAMASTLGGQGRSLEERGSDGLTAAQRFFLASAFGWCGSYRADFGRTLVTTNPHSLPKYRLNNVVANMPEFQHAFGCKKGQPMVRENACRIW